MMVSLQGVHKTSTLIRENTIHSEQSFNCTTNLTTCKQLFINLVLLNFDSHQPRAGPLPQLCSLLLAACSLKLSKSNFLTGAFEDNCIIEQAISTGVSLTS